MSVNSGFNFIILDRLSIFLKHSFFLLLVLICFTCQTRRQYTTKPTKSLVNPDSDLLEVNAVAYHINDSTTTAYLDIINENLVYKRPDTSLAFYAELKISYRLLAEPNSRKVLDSSSFYLFDRQSDKVEMRSIDSRFNLKALYGNNYYLDLQVLDLNKKIKYSKGLNIYKKDRVSEQNFLVTKNGAIAFGSHFLRDEQVIVKFSNHAISQVTVDCFFHEFGPALPPFSSKSPDPLKYKPDSQFVLILNANQYLLTISEKGFSPVKSAPAILEVLTLYTYDKTFPGVSNSYDMINCARYIISKPECE